MTTAALRRAARMLGLGRLLRRLGLAALVSRDTPAPYGDGRAAGRIASVVERMG